MKKICGYKSKSGQFFDKESDCEKADLEYDLVLVCNTLNNFESNIEDAIFRKGSSEHSVWWRNNRGTVLEIVCKQILKDSDKFIKIIGEKKRLESKLDKLRKLKNSWWLKTKWW